MNYTILKMKKNDYDVIVVGAGLSGLSCAYELVRKKRKYWFWKRIVMPEAERHLFMIMA